MSSFACLRVELPQAWASKFDAIRAQLVKIVEIYLEGRWNWPRRFARLTDLVFLLEDPRVAALDASELCQLADHLQHHLFGQAQGGEISLLLFEGPSRAVSEFAAFSYEDVRGAIADPDLLPLGGRLTRIRPGAPPVLAAVGPQPHDPATAPAGVVAAPPAPAYRVGVIGTYLLSRELFVADLLAVRPEHEPYFYSTVDGERALPPDEAAFDETCFRGVNQVLAQKEGGLPLGVPVAYSNFARPAQARRLQQLLKLLPPDRRMELNASVYGVPRHLAVGVSQMHPVLDPYFRSINLVTSDPGFQVEQVAAQSIGCVVLCVRDSDVTARQAAIRAFASRREAYRHRGVRQVLANLRTPAELELASRVELPMVSGPAISGFIEAPVGGHTVPLNKLPICPVAVKPGNAAP